MGKLAQRESPERRLLSVSEAARLLGIGRSALWSRIAMGDIPTVALGGAQRKLRRIDVADLDAYIARCRAAASEARS